MSSYRYSHLANSDLDEIALYLFNLNPSAAHRLLETLDKTCQLLAEHSEIGRRRPELGADLRSYPVGNYLIFYSIAQDGIIVVRILYGARNLPRIFGE